MRWGSINTVPPRSVLKPDIALWQAVDYVNTSLAGRPCVDCGTDDVRVQEFDHVDPGIKRAAVSALDANGYSLATVQREIAFCHVHCANCHTIRTRRQLGWWREDC